MHPKIQDVKDVKELPNPYYAFQNKGGEDGKAEAVKGAEKRGAKLDVVYRYIDGDTVTWAFDWK